MTTFVLVHGGFHGAWCWDLVVPRLRAAGHRVLAPDLPGMGNDRTPHRDVSLQTWARYITDLVSTLPEDVVLVGHSLGGHAIAEAVELAPEKIAGVIYVSAVLLPAGVSPIDWRGEDSASVAGGSTLSEDGFSASCDPQFAMDRFYAMAPADLAADAVKKLGAQPVMPLVTASSVTPERFGAVPKVYIECSQDQVLSLSDQAKLQSYWSCVATYRMDSDHSPFLCSPDQLTDLLIAASDVLIRGTSPAQSV